MDDYNIASLSESKNEWCARLVNAMTPAVIEGLRSIFKEATELCAREDQEEKYLMTFQTYLSRIPKWNDEIIQTERDRIEERSRCGYLEDLITCVHVVQLKALTCVRVGQKQKCVDLDVPSANTFVHKVYTLVARRLYTSVYLFEKEIAPLEKQKRGRELEILVKECIMDAIRDSVPVEQILKAYVAQTEEQVEEAGSGPPLPPAPAPPAPAPPSPLKQTISDTTKGDAQEPAPSVQVTPTTTPVSAAEPSTAESPNVEATPAPPPPTATFPEAASPAQRAGVDDQGVIRFSNTDNAVDTLGKEESVAAPKDDNGLLAAEAAREARAPPVDDEPISLAIREMGGITGLPDATLEIEDVEVLG